MPLESAIAIFSSELSLVKTDVAVTKTQQHAHEKLDDERFGRILADIIHIKNGQAQIGIAYREGIERVHVRIDEVVTRQAALQAVVETLPEATKSAVRESAASMKNYIVMLALTGVGLLAWELLKTFVLKVG